MPRKVILWALRKLGVEEWIVRLVQGMYAKSEEFELKISVHQGFYLACCSSSYIVLEALSQVFHSVTLEWAATASSAMAASTSAQEMQWAQALDKGPDYRCTRCQGTARPLDGRPQREVCPKKHALSSRWL